MSSSLELWLPLSVCPLERNCCSFPAEIQPVASMLLFVKRRQLTHKNVSADIFATKNLDSQIRL